jgi:hypothetical protein
MGGTESKASTSQKIKNNVVNKSTLNYLNKVVVDTIVNVTIENVKTCSASLIQNQKFELIGVHAAGDININVTQVQQGMLNFECIQNDKVHNDTTSQVVNQIISQLKNSLDTETFNNLDAETQAKSKSDFLAMSDKSKADSKTKQNVKNNITNDTTRNIESLVNYSTNLGFTNKNFDSCIASVVANQSVKARNLSSGKNISFTVDQRQGVTLFTKCVQSSDVANKITSGISNFLGLTVVDDTKNKTSTTGTAKTVSDALSNGPIGSIGTAFANAFSPITDLLSSLSGLSATAAGVIGTLCTICILIIICLCCLSSVGGVGKFLYSQSQN